MSNFNALEVKNAVVAWIRDWFQKNGDGCNAIIGISGGKDSSVVAALCVEALGKERVFGVLMPNGDQPDIEDSIALVRHLGVDPEARNQARDPRQMEHPDCYEPACQNSHGDAVCGFSVSEWSCCQYLQPQRRLGRLRHPLR